MTVLCVLLLLFAGIRQLYSSLCTIDDVKLTRSKAFIIPSHCTNLDLREFVSKDEDYEFLRRSLASSNSNVRSINLSKNSISDDEIETFIKYVSKNFLAIEELDFSSNEISDIGASEISKHLKQLKALKVLILEDNFISNIGLSKILGSTDSSYCLSLIDFTNNPIIIDVDKNDYETCNTHTCFQVKLSYDNNYYESIMTPTRNEENEEFFPTFNSRLTMPNTLTLNELSKVFNDHQNLTHAFEICNLESNDAMTSFIIEKGVNTISQLSELESLDLEDMYSQFGGHNRSVRYFVRCICNILHIISLIEVMDAPIETFENSTVLPSNSKIDINGNNNYMSLNKMSLREVCSTGIL